MRFQQINQQFIRIEEDSRRRKIKRITKKNLNSLEALIKAHNEVTVMVKDCNLLFSKLLGVYRLYARFIVNLLLFISIYGKSLIYARIVASVLAVFTIIGLYLVSYLPAKVSTEAHRCYNTINSINARNKIPVMARLKVRFVFKTTFKIDLIYFLMSFHFHF
jgi:hypothetical protein